MNENQITVLLNVLLAAWEDAVTREETLKLILQDASPDWRHQYREYWNDSTTLETVMKTTAPMRRIVKSAIQGELSDSSLQQAVQAAQHKPL